MSGAIERLAAIGAAAMLALSPVTGIQGQTPASICGQMTQNSAWGGKSDPPRQPFHAVKACHACVPEKRKPRPGCPDPSDG